jgi:hypothetical protein
MNKTGGLGVHSKGVCGHRRVVCVRDGGADLGIRRVILKVAGGEGDQRGQDS